jgi:hypothetical protein
MIKKEKELTDDLKRLMGKDFTPSVQTDILYIPSSFNGHGFAKIPYYLSAFMSGITGSIFIYSIVSEWVKRPLSEFRNEGVFIAFLLFFLMFSLFLVCKRYFNQSQKRQKQIETGEIKFGLWLTPTHILTHDLNEGVRAVAKKNVAYLEVYKSGKPRIDLVLVHVSNKEVMRIAADWLNGYYQKAEALKILIESKLMSDKIKPIVIDYFLNSHNVPSTRYNRFFSLFRFIEVYDIEHQLNVEEKRELINYINKKIENWSPEERLAEKEWFICIASNENWEYGVNGITSSEEFLGYLKKASWLMPLAQTAILDFKKADLLTPKNVEDFVDTDAYKGLESLTIDIMMSDYCIEKIMSSNTFTHLKTLKTPRINYVNQSLKQVFEDWKIVHGIQS